MTNSSTGLKKMAMTAGPRFQRIPGQLSRSRGVGVDTDRRGTIIGEGESEFLKGPETNTGSNPGSGNKNTLQRPWWTSVESFKGE